MAERNARVGPFVPYPWLLISGLGISSMIDISLFFTLRR